MKKQIVAISFLAVSLLVLPGCWKSNKTEETKKAKKVVVNTVTKKAPKELIENNNDSVLNLDEESIKDIEA